MNKKKIELLNKLESIDEKKKDAQKVIPEQSKAPTEK